MAWRKSGVQVPSGPLVAKITTFGLATVQVVCQIARTRCATLKRRRPLRDGRASRLDRSLTVRQYTDMNPPSGSNEERTRRGESLTDVILLIFRSNGLLLAAGDALAAHEHLTSA